MSAQTPQILIVEDSPDTVAILKAVLNKHGYEAHTADNGRLALSMLRQQKVKPDLAILDIHLPDLSGYEICEEMQADDNLSLIPVVFLTGAEQKESRLRAFQLGAVGYLNKPVISDLLLEQVRKALEVRQQWLESFKPAPSAAVAVPLEAGSKPAPHRTQPLVMEEVLQRQAASTGPLPTLSQIQNSKALAPQGSTAKAVTKTAANNLPVPVKNEALTRHQGPHLSKSTGDHQGLVQTQNLPLEIQGNFAGLVMALIKQLGKDPQPGLSPETLYEQAQHWALTTGDLARLVSRYTDMPLIESIHPDQVKLGVLPLPFCRKYQVVPFTTPDKLAFAMPHPFLMEVNDVLRRYPSAERYIADPALIMSLFEGGEIRKPVTASSAPVVPLAKPEMADLMDELQNRYANVLDNLTGAPTEELPELELAGPTDAPMVRLVNQIIDEAYRERASDIHIDPWEEAVVVRYRIDGELKDKHVLKPPGLIQPLTARIKIMANLNIAERRLPQDGRIVFKNFSRRAPDLDLRVATSPMNFGEKVVMRLIDKQKSTLPLDELGLSKRNLALYRTLIHSPYGMVLHVGPTGSGKSMTLYSALNEISTPEINVMTAEDPIEYTLPRINQLQVQPEIGLTFARALRSYLRQDPDVILVGEIRDGETAHIAVEAALTGHLLLSTLHTNDAAATLTRFLEMGIEPFMISPSVVMICAQRLMRKLCPHCREPYAASPEEKRQLALPADGRLTLYRPGGCEQCGGQGFWGRIGIHELLVPTEKIRSALSETGMTTEKLKRLAVAEGMTTLYWDAMDKVRQGISSMSEALSRIQPDEFDSRPTWLRENGWS